MALLTEPDVMRFRHDYYALLTRLLAREPDAALLDSLRTGIEERAVGAAQVHPLMGAGWQAIQAQLENGLEPIVEEYTRIFLGPTGDLLNPYESYYMMRKFYGEPLAGVRGFMSRQNLEVDANEQNEPEDALAFQLSVILQLIHRQQAAGDADPESFVAAQREFLSGHLMIWAPTCAADLEANPSAAFYRGVAQVLRGFLEVERDFFGEDGGLEVETLEEARRRYHSRGFQGPIFDPETLRKGDPRGEPKDD